MRPRLSLAAAGSGLLLAVSGTGCGPGTTHASVPGGDVGHGKQLIQYYGCGACHQISGISGANGHVGPSLENYAAGRFIAGKLPNTAANLERFVESPQQVIPGGQMPDLQIGPNGARDIAAYLYSQ